MLLAVGLLVIALTAARIPRAAARPRLTLLAIVLFGMTLHLGLIGRLREGFGAFHRRTLTAGHSVFLVEAVSGRSLRQTFAAYEDSPPAISSWQ